MHFSIVITSIVNLYCPPVSLLLLTRVFSLTDKKQDGSVENRKKGKLLTHHKKKWHIAWHLSKCISCWPFSETLPIEQQSSQQWLCVSDCTKDCIFFHDPMSVYS